MNRYPRVLLFGMGVLLKFAAQFVGSVAVMVAGTQMIAQGSLVIATLGFPVFALGAMALLRTNRRFFERRAAAKLSKPVVMPAPMVIDLTDPDSNIISLADFRARTDNKKASSAR